MSLSLSGEKVNNTAVILNCYQKKLLFMNPIFYRAFVIKHSLLFLVYAFWRVI